MSNFEKSNSNLDLKKRGNLDVHQMPRYLPNIYKLTGSNEMKSRHSAIKKANNEKKRTDFQKSTDDETHDSIEIHQNHSQLSYTLLQTTSAKETTNQTLNSHMHTVCSMAKSERNIPISFPSEYLSDNTLAAPIMKIVDTSSSSNGECETIYYNTYPGYLRKSDIDHKRKKSIVYQDIATVV